jgi:PAS domain S-box-containing protein
VADKRDSTDTIADKAWLYESVLSASSDHIYIYDHAGVYLYASPSGANALGLQPQDITGKHWRDLGFPSKIMERFDAHREEVFASGAPVSGRTSFPTLAGLRDYEYVITPILDHNGGVAAAACAVRDVTDERTGACEEEPAPFRFRLDEVLGRHSQVAWATEGHLRLVADSLPLLVSYVDDRQRYRFNNRAYMDWFGLAPDQLRDRSIREVLGEAAYDQIKPYVEAALAGQFVSFTQPIPYRGGANRLVHAQYIPDGGPRGEVRGFFALVDDIHDADGGERGDRDSIPAGALSTIATKQVSETAVEILHELGQPITAIASYSDAALRMLEQTPEVTAELIEWIDAIRDQAKRAREIVRRYRAFLRGGELKRSELDLGGLLADALRSLKPALDEAGVEVQIEDDGEPCLVSVDPVLLQQAICNVINNAVEAMGGVSTRDRFLRICIRSEPGIAKLGIVDSGPGVPEEVRERVFDPFFTTKADGVGVGLALTRSIVKAHGGAIDLVPALGCGACFEIALPACDGS